MDPPPSAPMAIGTRPAATAAAEPADDPPDDPRDGAKHDWQTSHDRHFLRVDADFVFGQREVVRVDVGSVSRIHEAVEVDDGVGDLVDGGSNSENVLYLLGPAHVEV